MLLAIHEHAERFFQAHVSTSWVPDYLRQRGFDDDVQRQWRIGYAPNEWRALTRHLRSLGFPDTAIEASGLARRTTRGMLIDFFRDRVMFPITERDATTIAFIGRSRTSEPKYLNSPNTLIYAKGRALFGLHTLSAGAKPVITEGPLDAIAVTVAGGGRLAGLALCGTSLTPDQVRALDAAADLRADGVLVAFDGDRAGRQAAARSYSLLKDAGTAEAFVLPSDWDPAAVLSDAGPQRLAALLRVRVRPLADLVTDAAIEPWHDSLQYAEGRVGALRAAGAAIATMAPRDVARQVARVAAQLNFDHATVTETTTDSVTAQLALADFPAAPTSGSTTTRSGERRANERPLRGPTP
ncbi:toprim domain-containing protein [Microbispora rosea]|uniref:Toprim domain-containing protein n=1 Tax=Microbispora hainanensis TaxID=568844 RepID=A0ABZ1SSY6_9ACTN|nr:MULTISPECIES: toprim domain-containing protein [Microbispora]